jgi:hypothetical protein
MEGFQGVLGTRGEKSAAVAHEGAETEPVEFDHYNYNPLHKIWKTSFKAAKTTSITINQIIVHSNVLEC